MSDTKRTLVAGFLIAALTLLIPLYLQFIGVSSDDVASSLGGEPVEVVEKDTLVSFVHDIVVLDEEINNTNHENKNEKGPEVFESQDSEENSEIKEPEMFENSDVEDDFEIPAFLRRQKN